MKAAAASSNHGAEEVDQGQVNASSLRWSTAFVYLSLLPSAGQSSTFLALNPDFEYGRFRIW